MKRFGAAILKAPHPQPCTACGPDSSPHLESLELVFRVEWIRHRKPVCEARAFAELLAVIERGGVPDHELDAAIAQQLEKLETYVAQLEIEHDSMSREIAAQHVALDEMDERITTLVAKH